MASKKVALILHGWPCHDISHHFLTEFLDKKGYEVFTPDLFLNKSKFTPAGIHDFVLNKLQGKKPDLIIGISIGGVVLPYVATDFPKAKLIFIASGKRLNPDLKSLKILLRIAKNKFFMRAAMGFMKLPERVFQSLYFFVNPGDFLNADSKRLNELIMNIRSMKQIPEIKESEIVDFAVSANNSSVLEKLPNNSLIFSGSNDPLMPVREGRELKRLLKHSKLLINGGRHYNILTSMELVDIEKFLLLD